MDYSRSKESWDAGFRAGYYLEKPGNDHGFDHSFFISGYTEGKAKREGKISLYYIDESGQVQFEIKQRAEYQSAHFFQEVIL